MPHLEIREARAVLELALSAVEEPEDLDDVEAHVLASLASAVALENLTEEVAYLLRRRREIRHRMRAIARWNRWRDHHPRPAEQLLADALTGVIRRSPLEQLTWDALPPAAREAVEFELAVRRYLDGLRGHRAWSTLPGGSTQEAIAERYEARMGRIGIVRWQRSLRGDTWWHRVEEEAARRLREEG